MAALEEDDSAVRQQLDLRNANRTVARRGELF
jgi:hypothetical protein